jgi:predicted RNA binding protein YcfA (HicA-like mRNA interferase family)
LKYKTRAVRRHSAGFFVDKSQHFAIYIHKNGGPMAVLTNSKDIVRQLQREGWVLVSIKGSHHKFGRDGQSLIVPHPKKDLPLGTARAIARAAGWLKEG